MKKKSPTPHCDHTLAAGSGHLVDMPKVLTRHHDPDKMWVEEHEFVRAILPTYEKTLAAINADNPENLRRLRRYVRRIDAAVADLDGLIVDAVEKSGLLSDAEGGA